MNARSKCFGAFSNLNLFLRFRVIDRGRSIKKRERFFVLNYSLTEHIYVYLVFKIPVKMRWRCLNYSAINTMKNRLFNCGTKENSLLVSEEKPAGAVSAEASVGAGASRRSAVSPTTKFNTIVHTNG